MTLGAGAGGAGVGGADAGGGRGPGLCPRVPGPGRGRRAGGQRRQGH